MWESTRAQAVSMLCSQNPLRDPQLGDMLAAGTAKVKIAELTVTIETLKGYSLRENILSKYTLGLLTWSGVLHRQFPKPGDAKI